MEDLYRYYMVSAFADTTTHQGIAVGVFAKSGEAAQNKAKELLPGMDVRLVSLVSSATYTREQASQDRVIKAIVAED